MKTDFIVSQRSTMVLNSTSLQSKLEIWINLGWIMPE